MDVDSLYRLLGQPGRFQIVIYLMLCCNYFPVVLNHLVMAIYGARTGYHCQLSAGYQFNTSVPYTVTEGKVTYDQCRVYTNWSIENNQTEVCPLGWHYDVLPRENSIITEVSKSLSELEKIYLQIIMIHYFQIYSRFNRNLQHGIYWWPTSRKSLNWFQCMHISQENSTYQMM